MRRFLHNSLTALGRLLNYRFEGNAPRTLLAIFVFGSVIGFLRCGTPPPEPPAPEIAALPFEQQQIMIDQLLVFALQQDERIAALEKRVENLEGAIVASEQVKCRVDLLVAASRSGWGDAYRLMRAGHLERCR